MRAAVLRAAGEPLAVEDLALRALGNNDVYVQLAASGVCRSDLSIIDGTIPHPVPAVLGHEGAGVVIECGAHVTTVAPGDHVVLSWVAPCRRCFYCLHGHVELCVALEEFHKRIPDYRIPEGAEIHFSPGIRQADPLPLVFTAS
jgi:S-(hydroxymethyl)glutathione dehydrogenase/alcohol dehydrogenase